MKTGCLFLGLTIILLSCNKERAEVQSVALANNAVWIDTVRLKDKLAPEQQEQIYYKRNFEEDYKQIKDTTRVALRFFWYRSFHPYTVVRVENRPQIVVDDSTNRRSIYSEWFATYKIDARQLNSNWQAYQDNKRYSEVPPFVWQQNVKVLPANKTPTLITALDSIDFWRMKAEYMSGPHIDGSNWTLDVYYHGKYHKVSTDMQNHPIKQICLRMLKLSGYKLKSNEVY